MLQLTPEGVDKLLEELRQGDLGARLAAAGDLALLAESSPQVVEALLAAMRSDASKYVRGRAAGALRAPAHRAVLQQESDLAGQLTDLQRTAARMQEEAIAEGQAQRARQRGWLIALRLAVAGVALLVGTLVLSRGWIAQQLCQEGFAHLGATQGDVQQSAKSARERFERATWWDPSGADGHFGRGLALYAEFAFWIRSGLVEGQDLLQIMAADFSRAIALDPSYGQAYFYRGRVHLMMKDYPAAIADFGWALERDPQAHRGRYTYTDTHYWRGIAYRDTGSSDRALADLGDAIALQPDYASAYLERGLIRATKGRHAEAIADLGTVIRLDPETTTTYYHRALSYAALEDYAAAIADMEEFVNPHTTSGDFSGVLDAFLARKYGAGAEEREKAERLIEAWKELLH